MKSAGQTPPSKHPQPEAAVHVRVAVGEHAWFNQQMAGHHYLGAGCPWAANCDKSLTPTADPLLLWGNKAGNWQPVGTSTGYSRHRADFYAPNDRPKKFRLYELNAQARRQLQAVPPPATCLR